MTQLTLYRCYWPQAFRYLKSVQTHICTESFGLLMTLDVVEEQAQKIINLLPAGAIVEKIDLDTYFELDNKGIDELLLYQPVEHVLEADKN